MLKAIKSLLLSKPSTWLYWISIAFISRLILFLLVIHFRQYEGFPGFWGAIRADSEGYLTPFENFIKTGNYFPDYRMPGYGVLYLPLLLIFPKAVACNIVIIVQLLLSTVSIYTLALAAKNIFKSATIFYITFYLFTISTFASLLDAVLLAESLATSSLILSVYFISVYFNNYKARNLIFSGLFLTWTVFLRPVYCPLILVYLVLVAVQLYREKRKFIIALVFIIPFTLIDGTWVVRNYIEYKTISPLTRTVFFPWIENTYLMPVINFTQAWGGDIWVVNPDAEATWFINNKPTTNDTVPFPANIYTSAFNRDSLKLVKNLITQINRDSTLSKDEKNIYQGIVREKLDRYAASIKKEKPGIYYVKSSGIRLNKSLFSIHTVSKLFINNFITWLWPIFTI